MNINSRLDKMTRRDIKKICKIIVIWCVKHLGENNRIKKDLMVEMIYNNGFYEGLAEYDVSEDYRIIRIYIDYNPNIKCLISSIIHEFTHDLQPVTSKYDKLHKKYGYINHPQEKAARKNEDRFTKVCWEDIKLKVEKVFDKKISM